MTDRREAAADDSLDVLVAGGGYVGLTTALAIADAAPHLRVAVVDPAPETAVERDNRASAIAAAAARMLDRLGVWSQVEGEAQPIRRMVVTDSRLGDAVRPVFLTFGADADGEGASSRRKRDGAQEPFAHMLANRDLVGALRRRAREAGVSLRHGAGVVGFRIDGTAFGEAPAESGTAGRAVVALSDGGVVRPRLLVAADGVRSSIRTMAGIRTLEWPYDQMGVVCTVAHERPHEGQAEEHFLPSGPFAILPLKGNRSSLVWTEPPAVARRLVEGDELAFEMELERRFGHHLGALRVEGARRAFPLGLTLARDFVRPGLALIGDAAHGIHPIAGQGLNLGFKDAAALAEVVVEAARLGEDIGSLSVLERYQRWRRFDTVQMGVVTDVLNRLFSNDFGPLRLVRGLGLSLVDRLPGLKRRFIDQAAGRGGSAPRLLRGEAI